MIFGIKIVDLIVGLIVAALIVFAIILKIKHKDSCCRSCSSVSCCAKKQKDCCDEECSGKIPKFEKGIEV